MVIDKSEAIRNECSVSRRCYRLVYEKTSPECQLRLYTINSAALDHIKDFVDPQRIPPAMMEDLAQWYASHWGIEPAFIAISSDFYVSEEIDDGDKS